MPKRNKNRQRVLEAAKLVVDAFDQADTGSAIRVHDGFSTQSRKSILVKAVDDLRDALRKNRTPSTLPYMYGGRSEFSLDFTLDCDMILP